MRYPQLLVHDADGALARALAPLAEARSPRWILRRPRRLDTCARLMTRGHPAVLVLRAGRDVTREMALVDRVRDANPEAQVIVVAVAASPALAGLAWHLGAAFVFTQDPAAEELFAVAEGLMQRSFDACGGRRRTDLLASGEGAGTTGTQEPDGDE